MLSFLTFTVRSIMSHKSWAGHIVAPVCANAQEHGQCTQSRMPKQRRLFAVYLSYTEEAEEYSSKRKMQTQGRHLSRPSNRHQTQQPSLSFADGITRTSHLEW